MFDEEENKYREFLETKTKEQLIDLYIMSRFDYKITLSEKEKEIFFLNQVIKFIENKENYYKFVDEITETIDIQQVFAEVRKGLGNE